LDEEKSKCAGLVQEYGFGSALLHTLSWLVQGAARVFFHM
jgi:hypothetical protein